MKRLDATSRPTDSRSIAWAGERTAGHSKSFGITDHSFARRIGARAIPAATWVPCVAAYNQAGWVGQWKKYGTIPPALTELWPIPGSYAACER